MNVFHFSTPIFHWVSFNSQSWEKPFHCKVEVKTEKSENEQLTKQVATTFLRNLKYGNF